MIKDIQTILWKEWKEFFFQQSGRSKTRLLIAIAFIGILLPLQKGVTWFNSGAFYIIAFIGPLLMLTSVVCDLFVGERERHTLETLLSTRLPDKSILLGKLLSAVSYSLCITLFILLLNIITVNLKYYNGTVILFSATSALIILGLNILLALLGALIGAIVSFNISTVKAAQQTLSISVIVLVFIPVVFFRYLPLNFRTSIVNYFHKLGFNNSIFLICTSLLVINLLLLKYMFPRYKRMKLLFD
jgi:ABC-2 type transport system permease protein